MNNIKRKIYIFGALMISSTSVMAKVDIVSAESMMKMVFALGLVLMLILGLKHIATKKVMSLGGDNLTILSTVPVGQKERVVLIDVEGEKVLVGVSMGSVKFLSKIEGNKSFKDKLENSKKLQQKDIKED